MSLLSSPYAPLLIGIVSGLLVFLLAAWVLNHFYYRDSVPVRMDKDSSPLRRVVEIAAKKDEKSSSQPVQKYALFQPKLVGKRSKAMQNNLSNIDGDAALNSKVSVLDEVEKEHTNNFAPIEVAPAQEKEPALVSRKEAIRSRRARAARKSIAQTSTPAVGFMGESPVAASIYRPRHMPSDTWGKDGAIRVRKDEYWDSHEPVSESRIQESLREASNIENEALEYVSSIAIRGTADDSMVQRMVKTSDTQELNITADQQDTPSRQEIEERIRSRAVASAISTRVAFIDEGIFPEKRTLDDLDRKDDWEMALTAMEERLMSRTPAYFDASAPQGYLRVIEGGAFKDEEIAEPTSAKHFSQVAEG